MGARYQWMEEQFGLTTQEQLTCGCHVHVSVASDDEGVAVVDRIQPWLPVLTALSGNSPYWQGNDTLYSSYRSRVWGRWPMSGPTAVFGSAERYHAQVDDMVTSGVVRDRGMIYFDARLSHRYPTVEIRVADVCLEATTTTARGMPGRARWSRPPPGTGEAGRPPLRSRGEPAAARRLAGRALGTRRRPAAPADHAAAPPHRWSCERCSTKCGRRSTDSDDLVWARKATAELLARGNGARIQRALFARHRKPRRVWSRHVCAAPWASGN